MQVRLALAVLVATLSVASSAAVPIIVHRDPGCGCCGKWAAQVRKQFGRPVTMIDDPHRYALQRSRGIPADLSSCHTAVVDGLVFEGHVPIPDMKRLLAQRPRGVLGLAVAGMPIGSPGMEITGQPAQSYRVVAFGRGGRTVFARYGR